MGCSGLLILGLVLNVAHCLEIQGLDGEPLLEITQNVTAVLGEEVYLDCRYLGTATDIISAEWKRQTKVKSKRLAGFINGKPFSRNDFSDPDSLTNLTVKMKVSSVEAEGEYICEFESEEENYYDKVFLTVVARPDVQILVTTETLNGSHYQSVSCSAVGGRPRPQISWLIAGRPPSGDHFSVNVTETAHPDGTSTLSSILHFPTRLQDEENVTCEVQHPTLPEPRLTTVRVETFTRPNVTIEAEMVQEGGSDFWVVSCVSSGGRPDADISLALNSDDELQREDSSDPDRQTSSISVRLPVTEFEGRNVTCVFDHPKFTQQESRVQTLPYFYLSAELKSELETSSDDFHDTELQEGQKDAIITLQVTGNVPRYNVTCKKDDGPLPDDVQQLGSSLTVRGPVDLQHAGLYECVVSYHHLEAALKFNVTVKPQVFQPVPPSVRVESQTKDGRLVIECSAADADPAANMSWLLPEGVSGVSWFNFTSHNGSHSVRGVLLLPACSPWELAAECVINHPAFEEPQNRSITLPLCARPNITVNASTEWRDGDEYTRVDCSVESVAPAATVTWHVGNSDSSISDLPQTEEQADGVASARSSLLFLSSLYSGQNLTCTVEHPSLQAPETRTILIPLQTPRLTVSLMRRHDSALWLAVCECRGEAVGTNLAWVLPENAKGQTTLSSEHEGRVQKARLTYQFPLALHEGEDLTCVYGTMEEETIHVPRYHISSVRVLNHTTPLQSRYSGEPVAHRLALQEHRHNQRVLLRVEGNVPEYHLSCKRSDGFFVHMVGAAMVFQWEVTEQDEGLYTCTASFEHHKASVHIQVEVSSEEEHLALVSMICVSSAAAILLILAVVLWVCCKGSSRTQYKKQESLSALTSLMDPGSPQVKKPGGDSQDSNDSKEYAQLVSYSIVSDYKSAV